MNFIASFILVFVIVGTSPLLVNVADAKSLPKPERAKQLKEYLQKEKPQFDQREAQRKDILEELDKLNSGQNRVRQRIAEIQLSSQELGMALDNLSIEYQKQKQLELVQRRRLFLLLKMVYQIKKDGMLRFVVNGSDLASLAGRVRVLFRTLRSHSFLTHQLQERANRLADSENRLNQARQQSARLLEELREQEILLGDILSKKHVVMRKIKEKQTAFQSALHEFRQVSSQLATLFDNFESQREPSPVPSRKNVFPNRGSLPLPIEAGRLVKTFGKSVHQKFHTVTFQKGLEIEADQNSPVLAIMDGVIEFEGWVKGLGNVMILHHGAGFYSLNAHLFRTLQPRGTRVRQGDTIALVGDTGNSENPSLYFELRENGKAVDPVAYFSPKAMLALKAPTTTPASTAALSPVAAPTVTLQ